MRRFLVLWILFLGLSARAAETVVSFDSLFTGPGEVVDTASFSSGAATFRNTDYGGWWAGFAFSTISNTTANWHTNQYAAIAPRPAAYAVGFHSEYTGVAPEIRFDLPAAPRSVRINNTTWTALAMRDGSPPARAFSTNTHDSFVLTLTAFDLDGQIVAATNHVLADFRSTNTFIQTNWTRLDLSWMPPRVASIVFTLETTDIGDWGANTPLYFALADFAYAYGGSDSGIASTNPAILCWADRVIEYEPGFVLSNQFENSANALGPSFGAAGQTNSLAVCSLGDGGWITLTFPVPIADGPGPDFAVFENALEDSGGELAWCELAWCEVSSDGTNFVRFPAHSLQPEPIASDYSDPTAYGGLAGKHPLGFGTPFDLRVLAGTPGLDVRRVTHVRLVDIVGDGSNADSYGNPIYDPTPWWGPGDFDLDAVGVLNVHIDISTTPGAPAPALPGFQTVLEHKAVLDAPEWTPVESRDLPGFYRWRLVK